MARRVDKASGVVDFRAGGRDSERELSHVVNALEEPLVVGVDANPTAADPQGSGARSMSSR